MKLIIGIGNPGVKYARTRLNAGFIVIDQIAAQLANIYPRQESFEWKTTGKYQILAIKKDPLTLLIKPRTYLPEIGQSVRSLVQFYLKESKPGLEMIDERKPIIKFGEVTEKDKVEIKKELEENVKISFGKRSIQDNGFLNDLYLVHYDLDLRLNSYSIDNKPTKNEQIKNVATSLGDDSFWKIRIGVGTGSFFKKGDREELLEKELDDKEFAYLRNVAENISEELELKISS